MQTENIEFRAVTEFEEMAEVEALQAAIWEDPAAIVYQNTLINLVRNGARLIGARDSGKLVGFVLGYLGLESPDSERPALANLKMVSQRMAVLPEYRDRGIGYELKLAQRQYAQQQGIRLITWTYDPLQTRNAHLNIRKLGAIVREYWRDYYGTAPSAQVVLGSSDRFLAEWWVTGHRVEQRMSGKRGGLALPQYTDANAYILNPTKRESNGFAQPGDDMMFTPQGMVVLVEVPENYGDMVKADPALAQAWRQHSRAVFEQILVSGYTITDFVRGVHEGRQRSFYALSITDAPSRGFSFN